MNTLFVATAMIDVSIGLLVLAGCIATVRLLKGPGLADRIAALDVTLICFMGAIAAHGAATNDTTYLIALVVLAIIGFTATVAAARFLQHENTLPTVQTSGSNGDDPEAGSATQPLRANSQGRPGASR